MWPVIRLTSVPPTRDVDGSPATPKSSPPHASSVEPGGAPQPRQGHRALGAQLHSLDSLRFSPEWSAAPVAPSFPDRSPPSVLLR
jgi:hypothetical protein